MKKLFTVVVTLLVCSINSLAQSTVQAVHLDATIGGVQTYQDKPSITPADNQMWYGYHKGNEPLSGMGLGVETDVNEMIHLNGNDPIVKGKSIKAVRFRVQGVSDLSNFKVWLCGDMPVPADEGHIIDVDVDATTLQDTIWNEIALPEGYTVPDTGVYVGYSFHSTATTSQSRFPIITSADGSGVDGGLYDWEEAFMSGWQSYPDGRMGNLAMQVLLEGNFYNNAVTTTDFGSCVVVAGGQTNATLSLTNLGKNSISNIGYTITTNGKVGSEQQATLPQAFDILGGTTSIDIPLDADAEYAKANKIITITKVNGQPNETTEGYTSNGTLLTLAQNSQRRTLMEEYTGAWCGWCPRGVVGIKRLKADFGDNFIPVSIHYNDPMQIPGYQELYNDVHSYPDAFLNRDIEGDPYAGRAMVVYGIKNDMETEQDIPAEASLDITAKWANNEKTRISTTTSIKFQYNSDTAPYGLAYVLVADSLTSDSASWTQTNYFPYFKDDSDYAEGTEMYNDFYDFLNGEENIVGFVNNDVAIAAYGVKDGLSNSVNAPIVIGEEQNHNYTISIASNSLVQDKSKLHVVAFLIDQESGKVVNAASTDIADDSSTGITNTTNTTDIKEVSRYSVDGRLLNRPQSGLNIVRYSDGTVKKVIVK